MARPGDVLRAGLCGVLTGVGHELKRGAEVSVAGGGASTHVEHVRGERGQTLGVSVSGGGLDDAIAPLK